MKLQPLNNCQLDVRTRDCDGGSGSYLLLIRLGPLTFSLTQSEAWRLANAIADAIEKQRTRTDKATDQ